MKVVCVSDTHGLHEASVAVPFGDVYIHAGDFTDTGARDEVVAFNAFLGRLPHRYKLVIAGNHESSFDRAFYAAHWHEYGHKQQYDPDEVRSLLTNALYLEDEAVAIEGYVFYGTPWQPDFCNWAFNLPRGDALLRRWKLIPTDTDVLITHTPPLGHGDLVGHTHVGCADLLQEVERRVCPKLHVFGHVHEGFGRSTSLDGSITYFNASACTHKYEPVNPPLVFELTAPPKRRSRTSFLSSHSSCETRCSSSSQSATKDEEVDRHAGSMADADPKVYALMLHEWLRLCSHKHPFAEKRFECGKTCDVDSKETLRDFRVDGTTSGMLFESTLKLRPVMNVQKRALRYLFAQGFRNNVATYKEEISEDQSVAIRSQDSQEEAVLKGVADGGKINTAKERRKYGIPRRVTVAVLDDIDEDKEGMDECGREHVQHARLASASLKKAHIATRSSRRNRTLQCRPAVPKLALASEDSVEGDGRCYSTAGKVVPEEIASEAATIYEATEAAPSTSECALCKHNVHGHIHPESGTSEKSGAPAEALRDIECVLCKYKVSGHVHLEAQPLLPIASAVTIRKAEKEDTKLGEQRPKAEVPPPKRLSSWF